MVRDPSEPPIELSNAFEAIQLVFIGRLWLLHLLPFLLAHFFFSRSFAMPLQSFIYNIYDTNTHTCLCSPLNDKIMSGRHTNAFWRLLSNELAEKERERVTEKRLVLRQHTTIDH